MASNNPQTEVSTGLWSRLRLTKRLGSYKESLAHSSFLPDEDDYLLMEGRPGRAPEATFLGRYKENAIYKTFKKYGIYQEVTKLGFEQIEIRILPNDNGRQRLKILALKESRVMLLSDIIVSDEELSFTAEEAPDLAGQSFKALVIQWIRLQNPLITFSAERPALPGQKYPGLGVGNRTKEMLVGIGTYNGFKLITNCPEFCHNALMYHPEFLYLSPQREGRLRALWRDLKDFGLAPLSWAVYLGCVRLNGALYTWEHEEQIRPLCPEVSRHFTSQDYLNAVEEEMRNCHFTIDSAMYQEQNPLDENGQARVKPETASAERYLGTT